MKEAPAIKLTDKQLGILQHSLGLDEYGRGTMYRNRYVCGPGHHSYDECVWLETVGLMENRGGKGFLSDSDQVFVVTKAGVLAVKKQSPEPPKLTRAKARYESWLKMDCGLSFGEFLKRGLYR